jgi:cell division protease FtsH
MDKETLTREDMGRIAEGVSKRPSMAPYEGFGKRAPSDLPPVLTPAERASLNGSAHVGNGAPTFDGLGTDQRDEATSAAGSRE